MITDMHGQSVTVKKAENGFVIDFYAEQEVPSEIHSDRTIMEAEYRTSVAISLDEVTGQLRTFFGDPQ